MKLEGLTEMPSRFFKIILVLIFEGRSEVSFRVFLGSFFYTQSSLLYVMRYRYQYTLEIERKTYL
jgi:hypothetical protein